MNKDSLFDALADGEEIIHDYQDTHWFSPTETSVSLTDTRLLIRWKEWGCGSRRSSYSAIMLNSILRIDETRPHGKALFLAVTTALIGLIIAIAGFETLGQPKDAVRRFAPVVGPVTAGFIGVFGLLVMLASLGVLVYIIPLLWKETIVLTGTFGCVSFRLATEEARRFEQHFSEAMHHNSRPIGDGPKPSRKSLTRPADNVGRGSKAGRRTTSPPPGVVRISYREEAEA